MNLDQELKNALGRKEPPEGFAARVMAQVREREAGPRWMAWFQKPVMAWAFAAAFCLMLLAGIQFQNARLEQARGEKAKEQLMTALRIAGQKLHEVQVKVNRI
ncbi:MAG: hypothetical protein ACE15B_21745 [Bryobacteraceae bacterium]